ncbi:MAG: pyridoxal phosphate-dependent aminotransferase, partial [Deltaproteobacteria bacterium]|nr:pyridoxal phosphate-dependent aminotransferase [Deltaproteobacteria bacterium]
FGLPAARRAVRDHLASRGTEAPVERVVLTASTSEAYGFLFELLCDPGDEVLVGLPGYPLLDHLAQLHDVRLAPFRLRYDGRWHIDFHTLESALSHRTRAIVLVHPNNPTGSFVSRADLERIESLAAERGLAIVSDEVFFDYAYCAAGGGLGSPSATPSRDSPDSPARSVATVRNALSFVLGGLSKSAALPQMKLGWIVLAGPERLVDEALARLEVIADAALSVGAPVQHALPVLLRRAAQTRWRALQRVLDNRARATALVAGTATTLLHAEGGWYAVLRVPTTKTDEAWALELLREDGVLVQPGYLFDFEADGHLVVSLLCRRAVLAEGMSRLVARIERG